jgi:hypothetical protein
VREAAVDWKTSKVRVSTCRHDSTSQISHKPGPRDQLLNFEIFLTSLIFNFPLPKATKSRLPVSFPGLVLVLPLLTNSHCRCQPFLSGGVALHSSSTKISCSSTTNKRQSDASSPDHLYSSSRCQKNLIASPLIHCHHYHLDPLHVHHTFRRIYRSSRAGQGCAGHRRLRARVQDRLRPRMGDRASARLILSAVASRACAFPSVGTYLAPSSKVPPPSTVSRPTFTAHCRVGPTHPTHSGTKVSGTNHQLDPVRGAFNIRTIIRLLNCNDCFLAAECTCIIYPLSPSPQLLLK